MPPGLSDPSLIAFILNAAVIVAGAAILVVVAAVVRLVAPITSSAMPRSYEAHETNWPPPTKEL